jgi:hypothetical protein
MQDAKFKAAESSIFIQVNPLSVRYLPENFFGLGNSKEMAGYSFNYMPTIKQYFYYEVSDGTHTFFSHKCQ